MPFMKKNMRDPLAPIFDDTKLHHTFLKFLKFKQLIQTVQHDLHIKMCLETKFTFFLIFYYLLIKMGTKIQWPENNDFVKYLINSKKFTKM